MYIKLDVVMEYRELDEFEDMLEDEDYLLTKDKIFKDRRIQEFNGNLEAFTMLYYFYYKMDKYGYLFNDEKAFWDFKKVFENKAFLILQMAHRVRAFSLRRGRKMHYMKNAWIWKEEAVYNYINSGIYHGCPVLMVTWNNKDEELRGKWGLIVGIRRDEEKIFVKIFNGKDFFERDLSRWVRSKSLYKGLAYFR